jgi:hypothetical protein
MSELYQMSRATLEETRARSACSQSLEFFCPNESLSRNISVGGFRGPYPADSPSPLYRDRFAIDRFAISALGTRSPDQVRDDGRKLPASLTASVGASGDYW